MVLCNESRTGLDGWALTGVQLTISVSVAIASYFVLELPIRRQGLAALRWRPLGPVLAVIVVLARCWWSRATLGTGRRQQRRAGRAAAAGR